MELPDPYLPGAISLLDQLDKKLLVILRDGRTLIGYLRTMDQFANLVLHETIERIHVDKFYGDIRRGIFLIRGENVVLAGEIDPARERCPNLHEVSVEEILTRQREKSEQKKKENDAKKQSLRARGLNIMPTADFMMADEGF